MSSIILNAAPVAPHVGQEVMAFIGPQVMLLVLGVIQLDVVYQALGEELVAGVHLHAEGLQHGGGVLGVLDNGLFLLFLGTVAGKDGQVMVQQLSVGAEFHHLGVHEHELQFRRMLGIQQRSHYHIQAHGLTLLGGTGHQQVRGIGQVEHLHLLGDGVADGDRQFCLAAAEGLYKAFPNGYFDGKVSRSMIGGEEVLSNLNNEGNLGNIVILALANNSDYFEWRIDRIMNIIGDRHVYWVTAVLADDPKFNEKFREYASKHPNIHIVEWEEKSKNHPEYFYGDGIHVKGEGIDAYANVIYEAIYEDYAKGNLLD